MYRSTGSSNPRRCRRAGPGCPPRARRPTGGRAAPAQRRCGEPAARNGVAPSRARRDARKCWGGHGNATMWWMPGFGWVPSPKVSTTPPDAPRCRVIRATTRRCRRRRGRRRAGYANRGPSGIATCHPRRAAAAVDEIVDVGAPVRYSTRSVPGEAEASGIGGEAIACSTQCGMKRVPLLLAHPAVPALLADAADLGTSGGRHRTRRPPASAGTLAAGGTSPPAIGTGAAAQRGVVGHRVGRQRSSNQSRRSRRHLGCPDAHL